MTINNPYQAYQRQAVTTSKPEDLTSMLYQGLIKFIRLAKMELENNNIEASHKHNLRAQDILSELMVSLNRDYAISESLLPLYDYMKNRLIEANLQKKPELLEEVEGYAVELAETWVSAMKLTRAGK